MSKMADLMKDTLEIADVDEIFTTIAKYRKDGIPKGKTTGWDKFDEYYQFPPYGQLNVVTGQPGSGKSEWMDSLAMNAILNHRWKILFYSPENNPLDFHLTKLSEKLVGRPFSDIYSGHPILSEKDLEMSQALLKAHCVFANCHLQNATLEGIVNTVILQAMTDKVNMVVIDPWNEVEVGAPPSGMNESAYIGKCLSNIKIVAAKYNIHFFIVAHPVKSTKTKDGKPNKVTLYDISGSSNWFNKVHNGFILHRTWDDKTGNKGIVDMRIAKIKDRRFGKVGEHQFRFLPWCGSYEDVETAEKKESEW